MFRRWRKWRQDRWSRRTLERMSKLRFLIFFNGASVGDFSVEQLYLITKYGGYGYPNVTQFIAKEGPEIWLCSDHQKYRIL